MPEFLRVFLGFGIRLLTACLIVFIYIQIFGIIFSPFFLLGLFLFFFGVPCSIAMLGFAYVLERKHNPWYGPRKLTAEERNILQTGTFRLAGYVAAGEGAVSSEHVAKVKEYMQVLTSDSARRAELFRAFEEGKAGGYDPEPDCLAIRTAVHDGRVFKHRLVEFLIEVLFADGVMQPGGYSRLASVSFNLKVPTYVMERLIRQAQAIAQFKSFFNAGGFSSQDRFYQSNSGGQNSYVPHNDIVNAYKVIGVPDGSDFETVKKAYHRMMRKYHPDRLQAQGVSEEMMRAYTEKAQNIQQAYDLLKRHLNN
ncbi:DnaJ domain-containing protein [Succinimonas amylolytica]|uniref:DnaJ domain-containing protein n=1 Tax=Succinimonas amylolytica TaxID=83769 RepID=UPI0023A79872